ncbi:hypothetical protein FRC02_009151 [Tulasnella sp. 418]|nr:hypothetical protein FRC02_009151 [Tulasnella sp. 418]
MNSASVHRCSRTKILLTILDHLSVHLSACLLILAIRLLVMAMAAWERLYSHRSVLASLHSLGWSGLRLPFLRSLAGGTVIILLLRLLMRSGRRTAGLPPGPPTVPIFGNALMLSTATRMIDHDLFRKLGLQYGSAVSLKVGSKDVLILTDDGTAMQELFGKRTENASRPTLPGLDIASGGDHPVFERREHRWKTNRRFLTQHVMSVHGREQYARVQEVESTQLIVDLMNSRGNSYELHLGRFALSTLTTMTYGWRIPTIFSKELQDFHRVVFEWSNLFHWTLSPPVHVWPWLIKFIPQFVFPWKARLRRLRTVADEVYYNFMNKSKELDVQGRIDNSLAHKVLSEQNLVGVDDHWTMWLLAIVLEGGGDIVTISLLNTILALLKDPHIQKRAQAEIDSICDEDMIPVWKNFEDMPYVRSVCKESLRWRPPFPSGVPHFSEADQTWKGHSIPKGTQIIASVWSIHMNKDRYNDPETFNPERYMNHDLMSGDYMAHRDPKARDHFAFSTGRRSCPGVYVAEQALFLVIAKLLWAFNIVPPENVKLEDIDTNFETAYYGKQIKRPKTFPVKFVSRGFKREECIRREMAFCEEGIFAKTPGGTTM